MEKTMHGPDGLPERFNQASLIDRYSRGWMSLLMSVSDASALLLSWLLAIGVHDVISETDYSPSRYLNLLSTVMVFILAYFISGLYPAVGINPTGEIHRLSRATTATFFLLLGLMFWTQSSVAFSRLVLTLFWLFALVSVPLLRWVFRRAAVRARLWGEPVAVIGCGPVTRRTLQFLRENSHLGLLPVVLVNGFIPDETPPHNFPALPAEELARNPKLLRRWFIHTAVVVPTETPARFQSLIVDNRQFGLRRLVMISTLGWVGGSAIIPYDLQGTLGLEVCRNLLNPGDQLLKRLIDLGIVLSGGVGALPVIALISLLIRLESPGGAFYSQTRIGQDGKEIRVWKFRTMVRDADQQLARCLDQNPDMRAEWAANHKLKNDPRVTRTGRFLRKTSLDELPQLWNVLKGEMSLVGPRPIVRDEIQHYKDAYLLYTQVLPGLTGLWQVSGRSDTSYDSRVHLDEYYIRHWSIWMDIYVLFRTIWVVLKRSGAY